MISPSRIQAPSSSNYKPPPLNSSSFDVLKPNSKPVNAKRILISTAMACFQALFLFRYWPLHLLALLKPVTKLCKPSIYKRHFTVCPIKKEKLGSFSIDDGNGSENVSFEMNSRL